MNALEPGSVPWRARHRPLQARLWPSLRLAGVRRSAQRAPGLPPGRGHLAQGPGVRRAV